MDKNIGMRELRVLNRQNIILNLLLNRNEMSKYDIKKASQFSMTTVIATIEELLKSGYIVRTGEGQSTGGRRPVYYAVDKSGKFFIGLEFNTDNMHGVLMDMGGQTHVLLREDIKKENRNISMILEQLGNMLQKLLSHLPSNGELLGVGVGAPGFVDAQNGRILYYAHLPDCENIDVRDFLKNQFKDAEIYMDNSINTMCYAYTGESVCDTVGELLLISVRSGVGMGCLFNNKIYRGATGAAGEIGHNKVSNSEELCSCGKKGCLEAEISHDAIIKKMRSKMQENPEYLSENRGQNPTIELFVQSVQKGNAVSLQILDEVCYFLSQTIIQLVNTINPSNIVLSGSLCGCGEALLSRIESAVLDGGYPYNTNQLKISLSKYGAEIGALGAAKFAFHNKLNPPDIIDLAFNMENNI